MIFHQRFRVCFLYITKCICIFSRCKNILMNSVFEVLIKRRRFFESCCWSSECKFLFFISCFWSCSIIHARLRRIKKKSLLLQMSVTFNRGEKSNAWIWFDGMYFFKAFISLKKNFFSLRLVSVLKCEFFSMIIYFIVTLLWHSSVSFFIIIYYT